MTGVPQQAQSEETATITSTTAPEVQAQATTGKLFSVSNELRKISILGGSLIVILIIVSLILRYTID